MQVGKLLGPAIERMLSGPPAELSAALEELHAEDLAEILTELPEGQRVRLLEALDPAVAGEVLSRLNEELSAQMVEQLDVTRASSLVSEMAADDRADLMQGLDEPLREALLEQLDQQEPEVAEETRTLVSYGPDTAGGLMTTEVVSFGPELTVGQALAAVRRAGREQQLEVVYYAYVVENERLVGVISLRDILLHNDHEMVRDVMTTGVVSVQASVDQEEVARTIAKYDFAAVPVVDDRGHLIGIVTVDDMIDVIHEEASEDAQKMAAVVPTEESYFQSRFISVVRSRVTWLVVLFVGELLTASVMGYYEAQLAAVLDLVLFVPLIISSGGNSGSQSSSLIIRALALGEMTPRDWPRVLAKEAAVGITLGSALGVIGFLRAMLGARIHPSPDGSMVDPVAMGLTVALAVVSVVTLGTLVGSLMPLAIKRVGLDPAVSSTPFVASLVDVLGLVLYFTLARIIFFM